jgi:hypothetical protein
MLALTILRVMPEVRGQLRGQSDCSAVQWTGNTPIEEHAPDSYGCERGASGHCRTGLSREPSPVCPAPGSTKITTCSTAIARGV